MDSHSTTEAWHLGTRAVSAPWRDTKLGDTKYGNEIPGYKYIDKKKVRNIGR